MNNDTVKPTAGLTDSAVVFRYRQQIGSMPDPAATFEVWRLDENLREHFLTNIAVPFSGPADSPDLHAVLRQAAAEGVFAFVLDFGMVKWLNSNGLGYARALRKLIGNSGGYVVCVNMNGRIANLFTLAKLDHEFPNFPSVALAYQQVLEMKHLEVEALAGAREYRDFLLRPCGPFWKRRLDAFELLANDAVGEVGRFPMHPNRLHPDLWARLIKISQFQRLNLILDLDNRTIFQTWMGVYLDQLARLAVFSGGEVRVIAPSNILRDQLGRLDLETALAFFGDLEGVREHLADGVHAAPVGR